VVLLTIVEQFVWGDETSEYVSAVMTQQLDAANDTASSATNICHIWKYYTGALVLHMETMHEESTQYNGEAAAVSANAAATAAARRWWGHAILAGQHASGYTATGGC
jgi:hypothetical protein